jgi:hypothetical protein
VGGKGTLIYCWWERKSVQPLWKTIWRLLKKLKIELPNDPAIPLLGIHQKEYKSGYNNDHCTPMFIVILFTIAKLYKQPRYSTTNEWIKKMWYSYKMEFYSSIKTKCHCPKVDGWNWSMSSNEIHHIRIRLRQQGKT